MVFHDHVYLFVNKRDVETTSELNHNWFFFSNRVAGDDQSDLDIIVTFTVLGFCLLLLIVTVAIYLRSYENETSKVTFMYGHARISMGDRGFGPPPPDKSMINLDLLVDRLRQLKKKRKVSIHRISKLDMCIWYI